MSQPVIVDVTKGGAVRGGTVPANPFASKSRGGKQITGIVFHHSASNSLYDAMTAGQASGIQHGTGAQYYIDRDGTIYRYSPDTSRADNIRSPGSPFRTDQGTATSRLSNSTVIGIEVVAPDSDHFTKEQINASLALSSYLADEYDIAPEMIVSHGELQGGAGGNKQRGEGTVLAELARKDRLGLLPPADIPATAVAAIMDDTMARAQPFAKPKPLTPESMRVAEIAYGQKTEAPLSPALQAIMDATGGYQEDAPVMTYAGEVPAIGEADVNAAGGFDLRNTAMYGVRQAPGAPPATIPPMTPGQEYEHALPDAPAGVIADPRMMKLAGPTKQELQPGGKQVGDTYIPPPAAPKLADVGQEPPRPALDFTGRPPAADGVTTQPTGTSVNGRPLVEVGGEPMPLKAIIPPPVPVRPTAAIIFGPAVPGSDTRDWSVTLPKNASDALAGTDMGDAGAALDQHFQNPKNIGGVDASKVLADVHDKREAQTVAATPAQVPGAGVAPAKRPVPTVKIRVNTVEPPGEPPTQAQKKAINDVSMIPDSVLHPQKAAAGPPAPGTNSPSVPAMTGGRNERLPSGAPAVAAPTPRSRPITQTIVNPAYVEWEKKYGGGGQNKSGSPDDRDKSGSSPYKPTMPTGGPGTFPVAGMPAAKPVSPVVPPPPPRTIVVPVAPMPATSRPPSGGGNGGGGGLVVQKGDTLSAIARRYGVSVADLQRANGIKDANVIYEGQNLRIPPKGSGGGSAATTQASGKPAPSSSKSSGSAPGGPIYVNKQGERMKPVTKVMFNPDTGDFEPRTIYVKE